MTELEQAPSLPSEAEVNDRADSEGDLGPRAQELSHNGTTTVREPHRAPSPDTEATEEVTALRSDEQGVDTRRRRSEAGRKGGHRVHELLEAGRRYEQEHGLKSGRQRLRQLIELGKLYEQEHGLRPRSSRTRPVRMSRIQRNELLSTLVQCLLRIARPSYRAELMRLLGTLQDADSGHAA